MTLAVLFSGQGSQIVGMGKSLFNASTTAREVFEEVNDTLKESFSSIIFNGPKNELNLTKNTQPALVTTSIAFIRILKKEANIDLSKKACFFAGHSLGEFSAHVAAETVTLTEMIRITRYRGEIMQKAIPLGKGAMAVILGMQYKTIKKIIETTSKQSSLCSIANDNCHGQVVISGHTEAVIKVLNLANKQNAKTILLPISIPSHCELMEVVVKKLQIKLQNFSFSKAIIPIIPNVTAIPEQNGNILRELLIIQATKLVRWRESIEKMLNQGITTFIEIGSKNILSNIIKHINRDAKVIQGNTIEDIEKIIKEI